MSFIPKSIFAALPVTTRGTNFHLTTDPKNEKFVYCAGTAVIVRDLEKPQNCYTYNEHSSTPTAACFAPSGFYICSGDTSGKVRVWDTTQETHICKYEGHVLGGAIRDICWSPDSKRIVVGGAGSSKHTHAFMWDSGTSCGTVALHSKTVNAVAHRPDRPYRLVTVAEDFKVNFHHGVPYKNVKTMTDHTNFVNGVRYHPQGTNFCTVSSDKKALLFEGKDAEKLGSFTDIGEFAHKGGIMDVSYSADGTQLITASADKTVKVWDVETLKCVSTFEMGKEVADQQLGCLWAGNYMLSVSFSGNINYLDPKSNAVVNVIKGHQKSINTLETSATKILTSSFEGRIACWDSETGAASYMSGAAPKDQVIDMRVSNDTLIACDLGNKITRTPLSSFEAGDNTSSLSSRPCYMDAHENGIEVYSCEKELVMFRNGNQVSTIPTKYQPFGVAIAPSGRVLAVGDQSEPKLYLYDIDGDQLIQRQEIHLSAACTELKFSKCGGWLAGAMVSRQPVIMDVYNSYKIVTHSWSAQSKLTSLDFSPDSTYLACGGIDTNIIVGKLSEPMEMPIKITRAHPQAPISRVRWLNNNTLVSVASDFQVRQWLLS